MTLLFSIISKTFFIFQVSMGVGIVSKFSF